MMELGTIRLETPRLILRKFTLGDAVEMFENWASDDEVTKFLVWPTHASLETSQEVIQAWLNDYQDLRQYIWCIELKDNHQAVGSIGVVGRGPDQGSLEIGYCLSRSYWGLGLMSEALSAVADLLLKQVRAARLEARIDQRNFKSESVLKKCGFNFDRVEVGGGQNNLGPYDAWIYRLNSLKKRRNPAERLAVPLK